MASGSKFQDFVEQLGKGKHDFSAHTLKYALSNSAPSATNTLFSDITEISAGNGYSTGGMTLDSVTYVETGGTATLDAANETLTASGGSIGPFQYVVLYNATLAANSPEDPSLICYWNLGAADTITDGTSRNFNLSTAIFTIS